MPCGKIDFQNEVPFKKSVLLVFDYVWLWRIFFLNFVSMTSGSAPVVTRHLAMNFGVKQIGPTFLSPTIASKAKVSK